MSLTHEERQEIIDAVIAQVLPIVYEKVEETYLAMPATIGSLMAQHAALMDLNHDFYKIHPEFAGHKPIVQAVIEQIEGTRPTANYKDILQAAAPMIRERIKAQAGLDMTGVKRPDRHLPSLTPAVTIDPLKPYGEL